MMNSDKNKTPGKALLSLLKPNRGAFIVASLSVVMAVLLGFATPLLLAETIDCILSGKPSTLPVWLIDWLKSVGITRDWILGNLWFLAVSLVALSLFKGVFSYFRGRMSAVASERIAKELRENLYGHLQALPFPTMFMPRPVT